MFYQQGDLIVEKIEKVEGKRIDKYILAEGEATGHNHQVAVKDRDKAEIYEREGVLYMKVVGDTIDIVHEEHRTITVPQGDYIVRKVREYDHFKEEARNVKD